MDRGGHQGDSVSPTPAQNPRIPAGAGKVTLAYAIVATLWITVSDLLVAGPA